VRGGAAVSDVTDFRGSGWRFPVVPSAGGGLGYSTGDENITQSLVILLQTVVGERVMRADFGTSVPDMLFDPDSDQNLQRLEIAVSDAVRQWEPRVDVESVAATRVADADTAVEVSVTYRILASNTKQNLVFPYYLASVRVVP
jgi:phage baseplate assembly protein W